MRLQPLIDSSSSRRGKWIVLIVWILIAGITIPTLPTLQDITTNDTLQFLPGDAESTRAAELVRDRYPSDSTPVIIVLRNDQGLSDADFASAETISYSLVDMAQPPGSNVASVVSTFTLPQAHSELISPDGTTMTILVNVTGSPAEDAYANRVEEIRDITDRFNDGNLEVKVSGPGGLIADLISVFENIDGFLLIVTVSLVLALLIVIYRSPVVALVPIVLVGLVFQLASGVGALILDTAGAAVNGQTTGIMTVILFGAGTDYILFISARYREELVLNEDKHVAMQKSMRAISGAIASASGTLIIASLILLLAQLGSYRSLGPAIAIAVALMLLASLTLVPAVLAIFGRFAFWPFRPNYVPATFEGGADGERKIWNWIARFVLRRPGTILATTGVALLLLSAGALRTNPTYDSLESLPSNVDSVEGFNLLRAGFPAGQLAPTSVYIVFPDGETALSDENLAAVASISDGLNNLDEVASVSSPAYPRGSASEVDTDDVVQAIDSIPGGLRDQIRMSDRGGPPPGVNEQSELASEIGIYTAALGFLSTDEAVARIEVILIGNPYSNDAMDAIPLIRDAARGIAREQGIGTSGVVVGGETAENFDTRTANNRDTVIVLPLILVAIMLILGVLLRSVVAALYIGGTIILTYFATLGLAVLVFTSILGQESIGSSVPFFLFVFLNALGVDYSIYLMTRIREETTNHGLRTATERSLTRTGGVITSAGLILAGTFGALMTLPLQDLFQLGFAVSIGVLMDTFITRSLLVPSLVDLLGRWNWWPSTSKADATPTKR